MLNTSLESLLIVVFTPTYHSFGKVTLCLNSYKEVMKVEGGTLQMASTLTFVNNFMELIQGQVITWRSLALVVTTLVLVAGKGEHSTRCLEPEAPTLSGVCGRDGTSKGN